MSSHVHLYAFGDNDNIQLGGRVKDETKLNEIIIDTNKELKSNLHKVTSIDTNYKRTVFVCGGQAYITSKVGSKQAVTLIPNTDTLTIKDVKLGKHHILILTQEGRLYSYGGNDEGQLGYNTPRSEQSSEFETVFYSDKPRSIKPGNTKVIPSRAGNNKLTQYQHEFSQIACGNYHNLALTKTGNVFTWGKNSENQLGVKADQNNNRHYTKDADGVISGSIVELLALRGTPIRQIAAFGNTSYILSHSGDVYAFGDNTQGQLGFYPKDPKYQQNQQIIHRVPNLQGKQVIKIAPGLFHCLALTRQKRVFCWGRSNDGQLATNSKGIMPPNGEMARDGKIMGSDIVDIACGFKHSILLTSTGRHISFGKSGIIQDFSHITNAPLKLGKIFAGDSRAFLLSEDPNNPLIRNKADEMTDDEDDSTKLNCELITPVTPITGHYREFHKEQDKYAYSAVLNVSFLKKNHHEINSKNNSGLDYNKIYESCVESWAGFEDKSRDNGAINYITRDLLPSLANEPPCIEAIRLYMFLPLLPQFKPKTSTVSSIQAEYCTSFLNLPNPARKTLRNWFQNECPKKVFKLIVGRFTECVSLMCSEHSKPNGNISIRTPCNPQNHRSYEITDHPDPTTLVVANRAAVAMLKFLNILNYVNERRKKEEKLAIEDFYLTQDCLKEWDWTDDWTRRCEERQVISEYFNPKAAKEEIHNMDNFNVSFSLRKSFSDREIPDKFDIIDYGIQKHEQFFKIWDQGKVWAYMVDFSLNLPRNYFLYPLSQFMRLSLLYGSKI